MLHGIDFSELMVKSATARFRDEISVGKVQIQLGNVMDIPYDKDTFDRVFHCNSYFFWPDLDLATREIYRVMKPNTVMVTGLETARLEKDRKWGYLQCANVIDPYVYMNALRKNGFTNVHMKTIRGRRVFELIFATVKK